MNHYLRAINHTRELSTFKLIQLSKVRAYQLLFLMSSLSLRRLTQTMIYSCMHGAKGNRHTVRPFESNVTGMQGCGGGGNWVEAGAFNVAVEEEYDCYGLWYRWALMDIENDYAGRL